MLSNGAVGFKSFMSPSGINDFGNVNEADVMAAVIFCREAGVTFYVHAEWVADMEAEVGTHHQVSIHSFGSPALVIPHLEDVGWFVTRAAAAVFRIRIRIRIIRVFANVYYVECVYLPTDTDT
jgi:hypothetical protein